MKKEMRKEGVALVSVLSIMIILLIVSLAIVSLSTNNLRTTGNIVSRYQALKCAEAAVFDAMYNINQTNDGFRPSPYPPGLTPTAVPAGTVSLGSVSLNDFSKGYESCKVAVFDDNLFNSNPSSVTITGYGTFTVPPNSALIVGEGQYGGYKRAVKAIIGNSPSVNSGMTADESIHIICDDPGEYIIINGIRDIAAMEPVAGAIHANVDIEDSGTIDALPPTPTPASYRCYNGSVFQAVGNINAANIASKDKEDNALPIEMQHWQVDNITPWSSCGTDISTGTFAPVPASGSQVPLKIVGTEIDDSLWEEDTSAPGPPYPTVTYDILLPEESVVGALPVYGTGGGIDKCERYVAGRDTDCNVTLTVTGNTAIDGSLVVYGDLKLIDNSTLFVNGTLEVRGKVISDRVSTPYNGGTIITTGYRPDEAGTTPGGGAEYVGLGIQITDQAELGLSRTCNKGVVIFAEGNVDLYGPSPGPITEEDIWLSNQPLNVEATVEALKASGMMESTYGQLDFNWAGDKGAYLRDPSKVGEDVAAWFNQANGTNQFMLTTGNIFDNSQKWDIFKHNPSLINNSEESYFQGIIYTYGDVYVSGNIKVVGALVTIQRRAAGSEPDYTPPNSNARITLDGGANIVADVEYMVGGDPVYRILTDIISWHEL